MAVPARLLLSAALLIALSCGKPASFRIVGFTEAQQAAQAGDLTVVEAVDLHGRAADPKAEKQVPAGRGVLVFGMDERAARAQAAAYARAGNLPVLVFVPRDADERGRFYAVASRDREDHRGKDS